MPQKAKTIGKMKPPSNSRAAFRDRGTTASRGYGGAWQRLRTSFLAVNPLCVHCLALDIIKPATDVDHIVPHRGDKELFDQGELQALCGPCHSRKTARGE